MWWIIFGYVAMMIGTGTALTRINDDFRDTDPKTFPLEWFLVFSILWPLTIISYTVLGIFKIPTLMHQFRQHREQCKLNAITEQRQAELAAEQHKTALAVEKARRAQAERDELEALGLPTDHL